MEERRNEARALMQQLSEAEPGYLSQSLHHRFGTKSRMGWDTMGMKRDQVTYEFLYVRTVEGQLC